MADAFNFELVSPEKLLLSEQITEVVVPGETGYFTVMANHAPTMATLQPGVADVKTADGKHDRYVILGGFVDVTPTSCTLLAESAVHVDEVGDGAMIEERIKAAQAEIDAAVDSQAQTKAEMYLSQLQTLRASVLPA
ncbi:MAG: F0F1 ATP synthase subunit epsilon [Ahrensia sp.]